MEILYLGSFEYYNCTDFDSRLKNFSVCNDELFVACFRDGAVRYLIFSKDREFSRIRTDYYRFPCTIIAKKSNFPLNIVD